MEEKTLGKIKELIDTNRNPNMDTSAFASRFLGLKLKKIMKKHTMTPSDTQDSSYTQPQVKSNIKEVNLEVRMDNDQSWIELFEKMVLNNDADSFKILPSGNLNPQNLRLLSAVMQQLEHGMLILSLIELKKEDILALVVKELKKCEKLKELRLILRGSNIDKDDVIALEGLKECNLDPLTLILDDAIEQKAIDLFIANPKVFINKDAPTFNHSAQHPKQKHSPHSPQTPPRSPKPS